jgi:hypothetical protein
MSLWGSIGHVFTTFFKWLEPFAKQALADFEAKLTPDILKLMTDAVTIVSSLGLTGTAARDAAIAQFEADAVKTGVDVTVFAKNELNTLVELIYTAIAAHLPVATAATTDTLHGKVGTDTPATVTVETVPPVNQ